MYERSGGWKAYRAGVTGSGSPPKPSGSPVEMEGRRLGAAARCLREGIGEATTCLLPEFPAEHRRRIRERHDRTAQPRDQEAHARGRRLPRREQRAHARLRVHQVRRRERMVQPALPRHAPAWRHAGGSELIIVPWTAMTQSTQSFGHYHAVQEASSRM